jgi:hypothetical protein
LLLVGLAVAAVAAGRVAAAVPVLTLSVHARLAPVAGTTADGRFSGLLVKNTDSVRPQSPGPSGWRLRWKVRLPAFRQPARTSLRIPARNGAPLYVHVLCTGCASTVTGKLALNNSQAMRLAQSHATVVVLARSTTLRGAVKAQAIQPKPQN